MNIIADEKIRRLFIAVFFCFLCGCLLSAVFGSLREAAILLGTMCAVTGCLIFYFRDQNDTLEGAIRQIRRFLSGDRDVRIDCDREGTVYLLFNEINSLATVLSARADNEQQVKGFLKDTISDISHQLKTPLAALSLYNGIMDDETADMPELNRIVKYTESELDRMNLLVQNLLKLSKIESGTVVFEKQEENLPEIIREIKKHFEWREKQEGKQILLSGPEMLPLRCSRIWMTEAILNLVKNALDHTDPGDEIRIDWERAGQSIKLTVSDTGHGIHPEDLCHIFKRFYRSRFSKDSGGAGLGLPLARTIIEAHDGTIEAESELGIGTKFTVWL